MSRLSALRLARLVTAYVGGPVLFILGGWAMFAAFIAGGVVFAAWNACDDAIKDLDA